MKNKIAICSMFKDSQIWYGRSINQVYQMYRSLNIQTYNSIYFDYYFLASPSCDDTVEVLQKLQKNNPSINLYEKDSTYNKVMSTTNPDRIKSLSCLGDYLIQQVKNTEYIFWVESDLIIKPDLIQRLYSRIEKSTIPVVISAPCYYGSDGQFYDTWAYKNKDGSSWTADTKIKDHGVLEMSSVGSCALIKRCGANINFGEGAFPELCQRTLKAGGKVLADTNQYIEHPKNEFLGGRWI